MVTTKNAVVVEVFLALQEQMDYQFDAQLVAEFLEESVNITPENVLESYEKFIKVKLSREARKDSEKCYSE